MLLEGAFIFVSVIRFIFLHMGFVFVEIAIGLWIQGKNWKPQIEITRKRNDFQEQGRSAVFEKCYLPKMDSFLMLGLLLFGNAPSQLVCLILLVLFFSSNYFFHMNSLLGQSLERLFWLNLIKFLPFMKWAQFFFSFQILRSQFWWLLIVWIEGLFLVGFVEKYVLFFI